MRFILHSITSYFVLYVLNIRHAYLEYGYTMIMIDRQIGINHSTVSKIIKGVR